MRTRGGRGVTAVFEDSGRGLGMHWLRQKAWWQVCEIGGAARMKGSVPRLWRDKCDHLRSIFPTAGEPGARLAPVGPSPPLGRPPLDVGKQHVGDGGVCDVMPCPRHCHAHLPGRAIRLHSYNSVSLIFWHRWLCLIAAF